jgi:hypothetical protein
VDVVDITEDTLPSDTTASDDTTVIPIGVNETPVIPTGVTEDPVPPPEDELPPPPEDDPLPPPEDWLPPPPEDPPPPNTEDEIPDDDNEDDKLPDPDPDPGTGGYSASGWIQGLGGDEEYQLFDYFRISPANTAPNRRRVRALAELLAQVEMRVT